MKAKVFAFLFACSCIFSAYGEEFMLEKFSYKNVAFTDTIEQLQAKNFICVIKDYCHFRSNTEEDSIRIDLSDNKISTITSINTYKGSADCNSVEKGIHDDLATRFKAASFSYTRYDDRPTYAIQTNKGNILYKVVCKRNNETSYTLKIIFDFTSLAIEDFKQDFKYER